MPRPKTTPPTKLGRLPHKLLTEANVVAWYERKTLPELMQEVAGEIITRRFAALPKVVRDRLKQKARPPATV